MIVTLAVFTLGFAFAKQAITTLAQGDMPRLVYIYPGAKQTDHDAVQQALSDYMAERIGATIELRPLDWGVYNDQIGLINASGEEYDVAFTAPWINNYYSNVAEGYLLPLDDLLPEYAPNYWASMTAETWDAARIGGKIYGGINQQIFVKPFGPYMSKAVLEKAGLADEFNALTSFNDLGPILEAVQAVVDEDENPHASDL
jgi:putative aldouronate transport system substrate-binding protein